MAQEIAANWFVQARLPVPVTKKTAFLSAVQSLPSAGKGGKLCHKNHWVKDTAGAQIFFFWVDFTVCWILRGKSHEKGFKNQSSKISLASILTPHQFVH